MKKMVFFVLVVLFAFVPCFSGPTWASDKLQVIVSVLPQKYFVEKVGGDLVGAEVLIKPGVNPHTFEPKPAQMIAIAEAKGYFSLGLPFESALLPKVEDMNNGLRVFDMSDGVFRYPMERSSSVHDHEGNGDHEGTLPKDPHIWNSPRNVNIMVRNIAGDLSTLDPANKDTYMSNCFSFLREIDKLDYDLREMFSGMEGTRFLVFHPAWGYFARDYGLVQIPVEVEGKEPKPADLENLVKTARKYNIKAVLTSPQFSDRSAKILAGELGGKVLKIDPLAENWLDNMKKVGSVIKAAAR